MSSLNQDILFLIFEALKDDSDALYSCILVNKTWFKIAIPILWRDPRNYKAQFEVIVSHLSDEAKNNVRRTGTALPNIKQKMTFNYYKFIRYLYLDESRYLSALPTIENTEARNVLLAEIYKLFINNNSRFKYVFLGKLFNYYVHLLPGAKHCFSTVEHICCSFKADPIVIERILGFNRSIKKLECTYDHHDASMFARLINNQTNLIEIGLDFSSYEGDEENEQLANMAVETSLIKHANSLKHLRISWQPTID